MHCYGNILYFSTSLLEETRSGGSVVYYRPEWVYFWVYFVGMNGIWFVVPGCKFVILYSCVFESRREYSMRGLRWEAGSDGSVHCEGKDLLVSTWLMIITDCLYQSIQATATSFQSQKAPEKAIKSNGYIKTA